MGVFALNVICIGKITIFFTNVDTPNDSLESEPRIGTVDPHVGK